MWFLVGLSHKLNVIFYISTYSLWEFSNPTDTSAENVTLCDGFTELGELNYLCIYTLYYFSPNMYAQHWTVCWILTFDTGVAPALLAYRMA